MNTTLHSFSNLQFLVRYSFSTLSSRQPFYFRQKEVHVCNSKGNRTKKSLQECSSVNLVYSNSLGLIYRTSLESCAFGLKTICCPTFRRPEPDKLQGQILPREAKSNICSL